MSYKLFIDDERNPVTDDWIVARNSTAAFMLVYHKGIPKEIAFDHDLGGDDTSILFINMLTSWLMDTNNKFPKGFKFSIHSQNPVGSKNIKYKMEQLVMEFS